MSILNIVGTITVIATIVIVLLTVISMATGRNEKYQQPGEYKLGEPWTREPLLFSAVDEAPVAPYGAHHDGADENLIGGAASGKW
ncbi:MULTISPECIES: aa3-type cytochrome oxidase subunit CtaJ [Tsukamurella]|uniref:Uncharacterized protein n=1 Tax=Tsukamurella strandjordii TaxID=147577 RepID=A0AA90S8D6_9ACTN|nr:MULTISPECIES: hypothetical protein [Tsukamurella]MDP0398720.1 hypothetical protein [Tsukamurella strandjordii]GIZ99499.1 hypothetical protein TTY48_41110 [Tsukamurella sp. TY48]